MRSKYVTFSSHNLTFLEDKLVLLQCSGSCEGSGKFPPKIVILMTQRIVTFTFLNVIDNLIDHFTVVDLVP